MEHPGFFQKSGPFSLNQISEKIGLEELPSSTAQAQDISIDDVKPIDAAGPTDITFFDNFKRLDEFKTSKAGACFTIERYQEHAPAGMTVLLCKKPNELFLKTLELYYPNALRTQTTLSQLDENNQVTSLIDPSAVLEEGVEIEPGAIIGKEAHIGKGTRICAGAVIGYRTYIGRDCMVSPNAVVTHSLIGNNVTIHAGCAIGQDGFGYIMGASGHKKVPQIGRVIIQDHVEIGANTSIDRGALSDTIIGEGTKIDNLVQIAHNVVIGCHAVIVSQTGISGSAKIGNYVVMGGQSGAMGHIEIGDGAQIAASSDVHKSVPAKARYGGTPAKPIQQWFKEIIAVEKMVETRDAKLKKAKKPE